MRKKLFSLMYRAGIPKILRNFKGNDITVLNLHRISNEEDFFYNPVRTDVFEELLKYCTRHYEIVPLAGMEAKTEKPKMVLSFDDGYYDFIEYALPILKKYSLPSNHNLVNAGLNESKTIWTQKLNDIFNVLKNNNITNDDLIRETGGSFEKAGNNWMTYYLAFFKKLLSHPFAERERILDELAVRYSVKPVYKMMNWEDAKYCLEKCDVEIGSHTYNHDSLLTLHNQEELYREIGRSVEEMTSRLGKPVDILALPNGQFNTAVLEYSERIGIKYVLLGDDKLQMRKALNSNFNLVSRVGLVRESLEESIFRTELFHARMRKLL